MSFINEKIKIFVCYFRPWSVPSEDIYFPIQAGKSTSTYDLGIQGDDTGDNISNKNSTFSEFTAWYWVWKNAKRMYPNIEYIGLSHYRRFFSFKYTLKSIIYENTIPIMNNYSEKISKLLKKNDIILAKPEIFNCSIKNHFNQYHNETDFLILKKVIHDLYPEYDNSCNVFFENHVMSLYCIFISKIDLFDRYFNWLFPILAECEKRIDVSNYDSYQKRVLAFFAERLLNLYVYHNKLKVKYSPIYFIYLGKDKLFRNNLFLNIKFFIKILFAKYRARYL